MAHPNREVVVMVGDGSYLMMNSEIATSVILGRKLIIVVLDNRGFGCINRLQRATGGGGLNKPFSPTRHAPNPRFALNAHSAIIRPPAPPASSPPLRPPAPPPGRSPSSTT